MFAWLQGAWLKFSLLSIFAMLLASCGGAPAASSVTPQVIRETVEVQVTAPPQIVEATVIVPTDADPGSLVIYSGRSESLVAPVIAQFAQATGIKVDVRYGSTAEIAAALLEEGANSPADVFFAQDPGGLGAVAKAGLLAPLPDDITSLVGPSFHSPNNVWVGISSRARVLAYNTDTIQPENLPADIYDLTNPEWSGRIGWVPTNGSFLAMVTAMRVEWGEEKTREWLEGMAANNPVVFENNTGTVEGVAAGEVDIGLVNHYYLYRFLQEQGDSFKARNHFLTGGGPGSLLMVTGAGRLASSKNEENALRFLRFMLSPVAQQYFASQTYEYPLIEGVSIARGLPPIADLEANAVQIDMAELDDLQGTTELLQSVGILP